jgi:ABC-type bacteriocin/lantibiotic exporter with double-glycine peptidase domain
MIAPLLLVTFLAASNVWLDVPFVHQTENGCGSAVAWMVLQYWSAGQSLDEIHRVLYSRNKNGVSTTDLERFFRERNFNTWSFRGDWTDLRHHLLRGRPIIVCLKPAKQSAVLHFVTVSGFDENDGTVLVNDPAGRKLQKMARSDFEQQWASAEHWTLLVVPK